MHVCLVFRSYLISQPATINQYFLTRAILSLKPNKKSVSHKEAAGPSFSLMKVVIVLQLKQTESVFAHALVSLSLMRGLFQHTQAAHQNKHQKTVIFLSFRGLPAPTQDPGDVHHQLSG